MNINLVKKHLKSQVKFIGTSMQPFLNEGDYIHISKVNAIEKLKIGNVIAYILNNEKIVVHRIVMISNNCIFTKGDNLEYIDKAIRFENIIGLVTKATKEGLSQYNGVNSK